MDGDGGGGARKLEEKRVDEPARVLIHLRNEGAKLIGCNLPKLPPISNLP